MLSAFPTPSPLASLWPLDPQIVFLNHGSFGSCPRWILDQQRELALRLEHEPVSFIVEHLEPLLDRARIELAAFLNADPDGLGFVTNATTGVSTILRSLTFSPGDELLTNDHEYNACNNALRFVAQRSSAKVITAHIPFPLSSPDQVVEAILSAVTPRTRLVLLSHVTSPTGLVFPIERIVPELNRCGIDSLIDGAHAPGMIPVDLNSLNPTYYTGNCHKWLCAPKGAAFLWVREDRREHIHPLVISHGHNSPRTDRSRFRLEFDYLGTMDFSAILSIPLCINYLPTLAPKGYDPKWEGIYEHNRAMTLQGRRLLCEHLDIQPPAPESMIASLASVPLPQRPSNLPPTPTRYHDALHDRLLRHHRLQAPIYVFTPDNHNAPTQLPVRVVRIACQLYNSLDQIRYLAKALKFELREERGAAGNHADRRA